MNVRPWDYDAFVKCYLTLGVCIVNPTIGLLREDFIDALCWCVGWQWYDIRHILISDGVLEDCPAGVRLTDAGRSLCLMASIAEYHRIGEGE